MKNRVITIIILLSVLLLGVAIIKGISIRKLEILSISGIQEKNDYLNKKIREAAKLTSIEYPKNIQTLEETYDKYAVIKQKYEELSAFENEENKDIYEKKQYDIGYLWRILGKNATSRNLTLGMEVKKVNSKSESLYNLNFNVSGQYVNISQFIADLENNSDLHFRIYDFKMSGNGEIISATFTVRNVNIDPATLIAAGK